jgi:hypothetical protein
LRRWAGQETVLGVSVQRRVLLGPVIEALPSGERQQMLGAAERPPVIRVDADRLDLTFREILPLAAVSEAACGVIVGPKAGELGRLRRLFPARVSDAVVLPFGVFVAHVDRPAADGGSSPLARLRRVYELAAQLPQQRADALVLGELARFRAAIAELPFVDGLEADIDLALGRLGPPGSFGVFVRSDTNVEDLKDFTGAGLNLTVPNQVERQAILAAVRAVWASPFTERSYRWRQRILENPEHVYPSVILHRTVPSEISGVMVTADLESGATDPVTVSASEGVAAVVDGGSPETLVLAGDGSVRLLASARTPTQKVVPAPPAQGLVVVGSSGRDPLLDAAALAELRALAAEILRALPPEGGAPWDVEFGLVGGKAYLMQIRPLKTSRSPARHPLLVALDRQAQPLDAGEQAVDGKGLLP